MPNYLINMTKLTSQFGIHNICKFKASLYIFFCVNHNFLNISNGTNFGILKSVLFWFRLCPNRKHHIWFLKFAINLWWFSELHFMSSIEPSISTTYRIHIMGDRELFYCLIWVHNDNESNTYVSLFFCKNIVYMSSHVTDHIGVHCINIFFFYHKRKK